MDLQGLFMLHVRWMSLARAYISIFEPVSSTWKGYDCNLCLIWIEPLSQGFRSSTTRLNNIMSHTLNECLRLNFISVISVMMSCLLLFSFSTLLEGPNWEDRLTVWPKHWAQGVQCPTRLSKSFSSAASPLDMAFATCWLQPVWEIWVFGDHDHWFGDLNIFKTQWCHQPANLKKHSRMS